MALCGLDAFYFLQCFIFFIWFISTWVTFLKPLFSNVLNFILLLSWNWTATISHDKVSVYVIVYYLAVGNFCPSNLKIWFSFYPFHPEAFGLAVWLKLSFTPKSKDQWEDKVLPELTLWAKQKRWQLGKHQSNITFVSMVVIRKYLYITRKRNRSFARVGWIIHCE